MVYKFRKFSGSSHQVLITVSLIFLNRVVFLLNGSCSYAVCLPKRWLNKMAPWQGYQILVSDNIFSPNETCLAHHSTNVGLIKKKRKTNIFVLFWSQSGNITPSHYPSPVFRKGCAVKCKRRVRYPVRPSCSIDFPSGKHHRVDTVLSPMMLAPRRRGRGSGLESTNSCRRQIHVKQTTLHPSHRQVC